MAIKRRKALIALAAALPVGMRSAVGGAATCSGNRFYSAFRHQNGQFGIAAVDATGALLFSTELPGRAHAIVDHPRQSRIVVLARRPGRFAVLVDACNGRLIKRIDAAPGRHYYGHSAYSKDGKLLFTTENDYDAERGVIGVRNAVEDYHRIEEWPSHGIGPHELALSTDGKSLVIANGGILTHPDSGRAKLNIDSMESSLVRIDSRNGMLLDRAELGSDLHYLSIRHLAVSAQDDVVFGVQNEGFPDPELPLVGVWRRQEGVEFFETPAQFKRAYIGSVAIDFSNRFVAASAPRDGYIAFWHLRSGKLIDVIALADGCGVAGTQSAGHFMLSSGEGTLRQVEIDGRRSTLINDITLDSYSWDNHLKTG